MNNEEIIKNVPFLHVIKVTYLSPTINLNSRISLKSERFNTRKIIDFNQKIDGTLNNAKDYLFKNGFNLIGAAEGKDCYYIITDTFKNFNN